jgi:hypothetical protein
MNTTEIITWIPLAKQKPPSDGGVKSYLVTLSDGRIDTDTWCDTDFFKSGARDPKTGGRDYDFFVVSWAEMPKGCLDY